MVNKLYFTLLILIISQGNIYGQEQINESMSFQNEPAKEYSIFIPSVYTEGEAIPAFLALHPLNTNRWSGQTWCEELSNFAEANGLFLICPDGGPDGKIDDAIDTAFTSFLLDSAFIWYDIDETKLYATGFSWGGKTTYTYGLNHIEKFAGLMPIGAAITIGEISDIEENVEGIPIYIIHGSQDSPNIRFFPFVQAMEANGACLDSNLLQGIGHTIDFDNQVDVLTTGYNFLQDNACNTTATKITNIKGQGLLPYNMIDQNQTIELNIDDGERWKILTTDGQLIKSGDYQNIVFDMTRGLYIIHSKKQSQIFIVY